MSQSPYGPYGSAPVPHTYGQPEYEFDHEENQVIGGAAKSSKALAIMMFIGAAFAALNLNIVGLIVDIAIGVAFWGGGKSLQEVVDTQGRDVTNLLQAFDKLATAFMIRIVLTIVAVVFVGLFAVVAVLLLI